LCSLLFSDPPHTEIYTLSLHDALPISSANNDEKLTPCGRPFIFGEKTTCLIFSIAVSFNIFERTILLYNLCVFTLSKKFFMSIRSEEHTSELHSRENLVCRLVLEKKK